MIKQFILKAISLRGVLLVVFLAAVQPTTLLRIGFAVLWGIVAVIILLRLEIRDWLAGHSELKLPPFIQLLLALILFEGASAATDWASLSSRDLVQGGYVLFTLPVLWRGFTWAWSRLRPDSRDAGNPRQHH